MGTARNLPTSSACLILWLLTVQVLREAASRESPPESGSAGASEKELLAELRDVLDKLQFKRTSMWETKFNQMPKCIMGGTCAVKRGPRIGKLCNCPRRTNCSNFFLRCL